MEGGSRERHCQLCDKQVHNFAAMTPREIERLVLKSDGKLCARITRRDDGSLVTLEAQPRVSVAARVAVSASLALSAAGAMGQTTEQQSTPENAVLTGTVLKPDGSSPWPEVAISLRTPNGVVANTQSDQFGHFRIATRPGVYDVVVRHYVFFGTRIPATTLHEGEQDLGTLRLVYGMVRDDGTRMDTTTMGTVAITINRGRAFRHPWAYLKHLARKL
jgi:hypothetical protein